MKSFELFRGKVDSGVELTKHELLDVTDEVSVVEQLL